MTAEFARFVHEPDPDHPGWHVWRLREEGRFNSVFGPLGLRRDGDRVYVRLYPAKHLTNFLDILHGGALMGFVDMAMFAGAGMLGSPEAIDGLTVDLSTQMVGTGSPSQPLDAVVELTRETRQFVFLRGTLEQGDKMVASFMGTLLKAKK